MLYQDSVEVFNSFSSFLNSLRKILPTFDFGNSSRNSIILGTL
ncbi:hypothetical protein PROPEN_03823 [Proteus penneri ATCC 35198]|nr:hypothetical protein PROPEN_03823 [Proteus penneri ATCC 35198]